MRFETRRWVLFYLVWNLLAVPFLVFAPSQFRFGQPLWSLGGVHVSQAVGWGGLYVLSALGLGFAVLRLRVKRAMAVLLVASLALAMFFFVVLVLQPHYSRVLLLVNSGLFVMLLALPFLLGRVLFVPTLALGVAGLAAILLGAGWDGNEEWPDFATGVAVKLPVGQTEQIESQYHTVEATHYAFREPTVWGGDEDEERWKQGLVWGGGFDRVGDDFLLVTGHGAVFGVELSAKDLEVRRLSLRVPINREDFAEAVGPEVNLHWFRVSGLLTQDLGDRLRVVVSHHFWRVDEGCFVLRFSTFTVEKSDFAELLHGGRSDGIEWRILHDTRPCLPLKERGHPFAGHQGGGRMAALGDSAVLVTVGDHEFDGLDSEKVLPQRLDNDYGKTLILPVGGGDTRMFTWGHRNPQGLYVESSDRIWSTDHGPRGGDELNLLVEGENYGWPFRTYGTRYGELWWPLSDESDRGGTFRLPEFSWTPSIAPSNLIVVQSPRFSQWQGDLLVSSLAGNSLFRIHREGDRIAYVEPIRVNRRVRDFVEGPGGELVIWADQGWLVVLRPVEGEQGESLVRICTDCHSVDTDGRRAGPDLRGIIGRRVAGDEGFPYSAALQSVEGIWTEERLHEFLTDPTGFAPGTTMQIRGIETREQREVIIDYLQELGSR